MKESRRRKYAAAALALRALADELDPPWPVFEPIEGECLESERGQPDQTAESVGGPK